MRKIVFQFHKGTIKTAEREKQEKIEAGFNSIKVRLRRRERKKSSRTINWFQFHKGTIKTDAAVIKFIADHVSIP